ncbi:MAG: hypothetical protein N2260_04125 [Syntrophobacterales bacterium]|nr:hypothetical protein [Syntrophobacterales bacterium]
MKCPGQDSRFWGQEAIFEAPCPKCGKTVEFFKDEPSRRCKHCGFKFVNPRMDFGCAAYCRFAEECLGVLSPELIAKRESFLKDRVAIEAKRRFGKNFKALSRAVKAARYAEGIFRQSRLDNPAVIIATYLYELPKQVGGESSGPEESVEEAIKLLEGIFPKRELIDEVASLILSQKKPHHELSSEEAVFADAIALAKFEEDLKEYKNLTPPELLTEAGKGIAIEILSRAKA